MKQFISALLFFTFLAAGADAQQAVDKRKFFEDTSIVNATLSLNFKKLMSKKDKIGIVFPAAFSCKLSDSLAVNDHISVQVRGHFRRGFCYLPPLKLIFKKNPTAAFYHLKALKLVSSCNITRYDDQNLLREYLAYKIYNLVTNMSFNVRLLNLNYVDSSGTKKTATQHAFLIEDIKEVAKRNACDDWTDKKFMTERTNRRQMATVAVFEYMIGNTDWSVPVNHNIRLIHSKSDSLSLPYVVPYDFDFSGFVNTSYSAPDERLGIENVRQRLYRGYPRSAAEMKEVLDVFRQKKPDIYAIINNFNLLTPATKKDLTEYLDGFYKTINNRADTEKTFMTNARND